MLEVTSAPKDTESVFESPRVMLPPKVILPSITAFPLKYKLEPVITPVVTLKGLIALPLTAPDKSKRVLPATFKM